MDRYLIIGETPSKKNQKRVFSRPSYKNGKKFNKVTVLPSSNYIQWEENAILQIRALVKECIDEPCYIVLIFTHGDQVRRDSDNGVNSIFDMLQKVEAIADDRWQIVRHHHTFNTFDKKNPSCEIRIFKQTEKRIYSSFVTECIEKYD